MNKKILTPVLLLLLCAVLFSCKKEPGPGGKSTIYGKVFCKDYNATFTVLEQEYYAPETWVYIIYGDDRDYGDRVRTNYDGTYEFRYMRPGSYHVYAYSKDSTLQSVADIAVIKEVSVPKNKKADIEVPDIVIFN
ncbi:MAG: hypothetical protein NTU98_06790 [Bacteroidetes bacterium]|nr:hypothetical protein [Bacteroidota bacterium]